MKGHLLPETSLREFVDEVMLKAVPPVHYECLGVELLPETFH